MDQVVECLPSKCKTLSSNPGTAQRVSRSYKSLRTAKLIKIILFSKQG
jgi:hypothetical protein